MLNSVKAKVSLSVLVVLALCITVLSLSMSQIVKARFAALENRDVIINISRIEEVLDDRLSFPASKIPDWANWDDTFKYVQDENKQFVEANLLPVVVDNLGIDSLRMFNAQGKALSRVDRKLGPDDIDLSATLDELIKKYPQITEDLKTKKPLKGLLNIEGQFFSYAQLPVRPGTGEGDEGKGHMVFFKRIDEAFLKRASELSKLNITLLKTASDKNKIAEEIFSTSNLTDSKVDFLTRSSFLINDDESITTASEIRDINGDVLGAFSAVLDRDVMAEGKRTLKIIYVSMVLMAGCLLIFLLVVINKFVVTRLSVLNNEVQEVQKNDAHLSLVGVNGTDEISSLASAINSMLTSIDERSSAMKELLVNVHSGFMMLNDKCEIQKGYTHYCNELLGTEDLENKDFSSLIFLTKRDYKSYKFLFGQVFDDILPDSISLSQLPSQALLPNGRWVSITGSVVRGDKKQVKSVLMTLNDISELKKAESENEETQAIMKIVKSKIVFQNFAQELPASFAIMRQQVRSASQQPLAQKSLHTLKGNFGMFGLNSMCREIHEIEESAQITVSHLQLIEEMFEKFLKKHSSIVGIEYGKIADKSFTLNQSDLNSIMAHLNQLNDITAIKNEFNKFVQDTMLIPISTVFEPLVEAALQLAGRLGKSVKVNVIGGKTRVDLQTYAPVFDSLINAVRNSLDHGIESPLERGTKSEKGTLTLGALESSNGELCIWIEDDGAGIDFDKLREAVVNKGLCTEKEYLAMPESEKIEFIFESNVSTAASVSDISGRGLGMGGLREEARKFGGDVTIHSTTGRGSKVEINLVSRKNEATRNKVAA